MRWSGARRSTAAMQRLLLATAALLAAASMPHAHDRTDDTRRFLDLLTGVRIAYMEAFEDGEEELVAPDQLEEAPRIVGAFVGERDAGQRQQRGERGKESLHGVGGAARPLPRIPYTTRRSC